MPYDGRASARFLLGVAAMKRIVFDSNVLLSLFVFRDSRFAPLREAAVAGRCRMLADPSCLEEFRRVLAYPMFALDAQQQAAAFDAYRALLPELQSYPPRPEPLPACTDADDQKFLILARDAGADWLVTADKALLKLARRQKLAHLFRILTPDAALAEVEN
jgi:putative PIN family toxin of toxin-antitoxin system